VRGLAAPLRMMCSYSVVECEDIKYDLRLSEKGTWIAPEWEKGHKPDLRDRHPFVELPYVINHRTGEVVSLSNAVSLYLGSVLGLNGITWHMRLLNEQLLYYVHSVAMELGALVYPSKDNSGAIGELLQEHPFRERLDAYLENVVPPIYEKLEACLCRRGTGFLVGWLPCTADFHTWELLDQHEAMAKAHGNRSPLADFAVLQVYHARFRALPRLQRYFESDDARLPINNKTAFFK